MQHPLSPLPAQAVGQTHGGARAADLRINVWPPPAAAVSLARCPTCMMVLKRLHECAPAPIVACRRTCSNEHTARAPGAARCRTAVHITALPQRPCTAAQLVHTLDPLASAGPSGAQTMAGLPVGAPAPKSTLHGAALHPCERHPWLPALTPPKRAHAQRPHHVAVVPEKHDLRRPQGAGGLAGDRERGGLGLLLGGQGVRQLARREGRVGAWCMESRGVECLWPRAAHCRQNVAAGPMV